jgi:hypothetical protein
VPHAASSSPGTRAAATGPRRCWFTRHGSTDCTVPKHTGSALRPQHVGDPQTAPGVSRPASTATTLAEPPPFERNRGRRSRNRSGQGHLEGGALASYGCGCPSRRRSSQPSTRAVSDMARTAPSRAPAARTHKGGLMCTIGKRTQHPTRQVVWTGIGGIRPAQVEMAPATHAEQRPHDTAHRQQQTVAPEAADYRRREGTRATIISRTRTVRNRRDVRRADAAEAARRHGVSSGTVGKWRNRAAAAPGQGRLLTCSRRVALRLAGGGGK